MYFSLPLWDSCLIILLSLYIIFVTMYFMLHCIPKLYFQLHHLAETPVCFIPPIDIHLNCRFYITAYINLVYLFASPSVTVITSVKFWVNFCWILLKEQYWFLHQPKENFQTYHFMWQNWYCFSVIVFKIFAKKKWRAITYTLCFTAVWQVQHTYSNQFYHSFHTVTQII
jgi:hypothetical protein